jgi:Ala-tRNA(Pro) deacylase
MNCKRRLEDHFRENEIPYRTQHHARAVTAQEVAATEHVPGRMFVKTVMVSTDGGEMCMLAQPAPYHVNPEKTAAILGVREACLADEERFAEPLETRPAR